MDYDRALNVATPPAWGGVRAAWMMLPPAWLGTTSSGPAEARSRPEIRP